MDIVQGSEVQTQVGGAKINPSAFREAALAPGKLLAGAGQAASEVFQGLSEQITNLRRSKNIYNLDTTLQKASEDIKGELSQTADTDQWGGIFNDKAKKIKDEFFNKPEVRSADPVTLRLLNQSYDRWYQVNNSKTNTDRLLTLQAQTIQSGNESIGEYIKKGKPGLNSALNVLDSMKQYISPKVYAYQKDKIYNGVDNAEAQALINFQPKEAKKQIVDDTIQQGKGPDAKFTNPNFTHLDPNQLRALKTEANRSYNNYQTKNLDDLVTKMETKGMSYDDDYLKNLLKTNEISEQGYKTINRIMAGQSVQELKELSSTLTDEANNYSKVGDPDGSQLSILHAQLQALKIQMPSDYRRITNTLTKNTKEQRGGDNGFKAIQTAFENQDVWKYKIQDPNNPDRTIIDRNKYRIAVQKKYELQKQLEEWLNKPENKKNPPTNFEETQYVTKTLLNQPSWINSAQSLDEGFGTASKPAPYRD